MTASSNYEFAGKDEAERFLAEGQVAQVAGFAGVRLDMGFGVAVSLLIGATLIRSVLVPAAMKLLGRWNWYLPSWLAWLPDVSVEGLRPQAPRSSTRATDVAKA